jgi:hypothetical protein
MTDANQFHMPFLVPMSFAIKAITDGLVRILNHPIPSMRVNIMTCLQARDEPFICFPVPMFIVVWLASSMPPVIKASIQYDSVDATNG